MVGQLVVEVGPGGLEIRGTFGIPIRERGERGNEAVQISTESAVNDAVHTHFGHALTVPAMAASASGFRRAEGEAASVATRWT